MQDIYQEKNKFVDISLFTAILPEALGVPLSSADSVCSSRDNYAHTSPQLESGKGRRKGFTTKQEAALQMESKPVWKNNMGAM